MVKDFVSISREDRRQVLSVSLYMGRQGADRGPSRGIDGLAAARAEADRLRKLVAAGDNPKLVKTIERVMRRVTPTRRRSSSPRTAWRASESRRKKWTAGYFAKTSSILFNNHLADLYPSSRSPKSLPWVRRRFWRRSRTGRGALAGLVSRAFCMR